jgi:hypothetical protein
LSEIEPRKPQRVSQAVLQMLQRWGASLAALRDERLLGGAAIAALGLLVTGIIWFAQPLRPPSALPAAANAAPPVQKSGSAVSLDGTAATVFTWDDDQGGRRRAAVDSRHYNEYAASQRGTIAQDQQRVLDTAAQALHASTRPIFADVEARVPYYANWVFDWWTSWILLGRAFGWTWHALTDGPVLAFPDRVQARLVAAIQQQFNALVLDPTTTEPKLKSAIDRARAAAYDALLPRCRAYRDGLSDFIRREARRVERFDPVRGWVPDAAWDPGKAAFRPVCPAVDAGGETGIRPELEASLMAMSSGGPVDEVILRMARPFATKLISFVVLPIIVTALIGGIVLPLFGLLPNIISGVVTGIITGAAGALIIGFSASASVDWLLNRTDEALSRPQFESDVRSAVVSAEVDFESKVLAVRRQSLERHLQVVTATVVGRPPAN